MSTHPKGIKGMDGFLRLWRNECTRVFHDRLICDEDRELVDSKISEILTRKFPDQQSKASSNPLLFGDLKQTSKASYFDIFKPQLICVE